MALRCKTDWINSHFFPSLTCCSELLSLVFFRLSLYGTGTPGCHFLLLMFASVLQIALSVPELQVTFLFFFIFVVGAGTPGRLFLWLTIVTNAPELQVAQDLSSCLCSSHYCAGTPGRLCFSSSINQCAGTPGRLDFVCSFACFRCTNATGALPMRSRCRFCCYLLSRCSRLSYIVRLTVSEPVTGY